MNRYRRRDTLPFFSLSRNDPTRILSKRVTWLVAANFGLSLMFFLLSVIASIQAPNAIDVYIWGRVVTEVILSLAYFLFAYLFWRGKFWGYLRMLMTSALMIVCTVSVILFVGMYPWWLRAEQGVQLVLVMLILYLLTRPHFRSRFAKKTVQKSGS